MSTKTTFKRIALVAVAALGLGVVSSVAPASAATVYTTSIAVTTNKAPVAGSTGTAVTHTVRFSTATTAAVAIYPRAILTSKPASSLIASRADATAALTSGAYEFSSATTVGGTNGDMNIDGGTVNTVAQASDTSYTYSQGYAYLHAWYDVPGTYVWTIWDDATTATGAVNGLETSTTFTVVVGATGTTATYAATTTVHNATSVVTGTNGSLVRIALTSGGVAAAPDLAGGVKVTVTGTGDVTKVNNAGVTATTSYILGSGDFNGSGYAWVNITDGAAETITLTLSGVGSMASSFTAPAPAVLTFKAEVASAAATIINKGSATGLLTGTASTISADGTATANKASTSALTFQTTKSDATAAALDAVTVTDGTGAPITGAASGYAYDILVASGDSTVCTTYCGTFTVTPVWTSTIVGQTFEVADYTTGFGLTVTSATAAATTLSVFAPASSYRAVTGSSQSFTIKAVDQFGLVISNVAVSATIAGRNSTVNVASCITVAGYCSLTYTDASTSTTSMVDTLTFAGAASGTTATVTYSTLAGLGVSTVLATTSQTSATTGADNTTITPFAIAAGSDGVEAGTQTVTITVKDVNGIGIAGVPVSVTVAGTGAAVLSTSKTVYTSALGVATASVYAWIAPTYGTNYVVTATAGGVSDTVNTYWGQANADHTRTFTATNSGRVITVVAKDRFGNPVYGASFTARITAGDGFFGTGTNVATGTTDATGTMKFITLESPSDLTVVVKAGDSSTYAQTDAPKGNISTAGATDVFTVPATAGTATTAEAYVGGDIAPAGNNTVTVAIVGAPSATETTAQGAADAAAEATDAANAATDAANAAAEAADAATAAAQDAADAVAALSTQVTEMVSALKKQITALTNLVIKIQKKVKA
jgi:hypothetical protein